MLLQTVITLLFLTGLQGRVKNFNVKLHEEQLKFLANALPMEYSSIASHELSLLEPLLITRQPGSTGHRKAFDFIVSHFQKLDWNVEIDAFNAKTPIGSVNFSNIIVSSNPSARRKLILAAHYDSKIIEGIEFIGATDSAVPCAILMNVAQRLNPYLLQAIDKDTSLDMIFFDGEEAFVKWSANDSIYGARHLAEKWASEMVQRQNGNLNQVEDEQNSSFYSVISTIDLFVLLDLLGTSDSAIPNFFSNNAVSNEAYLKLLDIQGRLESSRLLSIPLSSRIKRGSGLFSSQQQQVAYVEDDHIPFLEKNVPVLHVIPFPFPSVWHTEKDNKDAIDQDIIKDWCLFCAVFVAEYLEIDFNTNSV